MQKWWQGIYKPFTLARNPQGSNHSWAERSHLCADLWTCSKGSVRCKFYGQPCSKPTKVQMRKRRLLLWLTEIFLSCGICFLRLVPTCSGSCGSPHASGCAYSMQSTSPCFWCLQLCSVCVVLGFCWVCFALECRSKQCWCKYCKGLNTLIKWSWIYCWLCFLALLVYSHSKCWERD